MIRAQSFFAAAWRYDSACACESCTRERERRRLNALRTAPAIPAPALLYKPAHGGRCGDALPPGFTWDSVERCVRHNKRSLLKWHTNT